MDKLLHHYERELGRLREATRRYAEAHPNTAAALELAAGCSTDPEVERLLQSVALLNAAAQQLIEDGRNDFHRALLQTLQPHYLRTIPASGIVQVDTSAARPNEISFIACLPRGTILRSGAIKFATTYDVCIAPITISDARFQPTINLPAALRIPQDATSTLIVELESTANSMCFDQPILRRLRIFIDGNVGLLDAILIDSLCVCLEVEGRWKVLESSPFSAVGLDADEALLPLSSGFQSPRMLTELFHLPQKYHFVDLDLEAIATLCPSGCKRIALHIVLPSYKAQFRGTTSENFRLACTPVANIFPQPSMPIRLDGRSEAYPVVPSQPSAAIHSIESVAMMGRGGGKIFAPFHGTEHTGPGPYWKMDEREGIAIHFVDREQRPVRLENGTITVHLLCTSGDTLHKHDTLTTEASTGGFPLRFIGEIAAPTRLSCLDTLCDSLYAEETTLPALCKLLQLHGCAFPESLKSLVAVPSTSWLEGPLGRIHMHGTEFTIVVDEQATSGQSIYVFTEIMVATLADKLRANRYAQLRIVNENGRLLFSSNPREGSRQLA